jgi:predicted RNase H-like HicB family nuclease
LKTKEENMAMELGYTMEVWRKGDWFVAKCPELDFVSQGKTQDEARENLVDAIQIQFEEMAEAGTLDEYLAECGYLKEDSSLMPQTEMIGFERRSIQVV